MGNLAGAGAASGAAIDIALNEPISLNGASKDQILSRRIYCAQKYPQLIAGVYAPSDIFDQIVDGKPWWGMEGSFVYGVGSRSIEGAAEESRFLFNPYLLVGANSWSTEIWDTNRIGSKEFSDKNFPFCFMPDSLKIFAKDKKITVTYDITDFHNRLSKFDYCRKEKSTISDFGLVAYNARDLGYRFIYFDPKVSINVENQNHSSSTTEIKQYIHCGNSCGLSSGCNNMSPAQDEIDHLRLKGLPARALVKLWREKPSNIDAPADMQVALEFR